MRKEIKIEGLDNLDTINENPEGTVFRARRLKEIESIIKILPYPVDLREKEEPGTIVYLRESKRLRHLNHLPNIHVVRIINIGLTEKERLPFVETELIKGPDLDQLLTFPNHSIFKIEETIKLLTQMADALAHTHTAMVKHGRINSNNIRLSSETGMYVLLNFGRFLLTDEQRKAEINIARAPEYLAPEQFNGGLLFESDIYSLGLVLFQVLTGTMPQRNASLADNTSVPASSIGQQIKELRRENLPFSWSDDEKSEEINVPVWLLNTVAICLQQDPKKRYANGIKLLEAVKSNSVKGREASLTQAGRAMTAPVSSIANNSTRGANGKESSLTPYQTNPSEKTHVNPIIPAGLKTKEEEDKDAEIRRLKALIIQKDGQLDVYKYQTADYNPDHGKLNLSRSVLLSLLAVIAALVAFASYAYFFRKPDSKGLIATYTDTGRTSPAGMDSSQNYLSDMYSDSITNIDTTALIESMPPIPEEEKAGNKKENVSKQALDNPETKKPKAQVKKQAIKTKEKTPLKPSRSTNTSSERAPVKKEEARTETEPIREYNEQDIKRPKRDKYTLAVAKAYFYDKPDVRTRRPVYLSNANESEFTATKDSNGFIYVIFFNTDRQITQGWLRKVDLRQIN